MRGVEGNVNKLYLLKFTKWFLLYMPIIVLFYQDNGLSLSEVMIVQSIYSITMAITEMPSGYLADFIGRKHTIIIGMIFNFVGILILGISSTMAMFIFAVLFLAFGNSCLSGTDSALLYDSLKYTKKSDTYTKIEGRTYSMHTFAEAIAAIFGGLIADYYGYRITIQLQLIFAFLGILIAFTLVEPKLQLVKEKHEHSVRAILIFLFKENKKLNALLVLSALLATASLTMAWFAQPYLKGLDFSDSHIGFMWSFLNLIVALGSFWAYKIPHNNRIVKGVLLILIAFSLGFLFLSLSPGYWGLIFVVGIYLIRGISVPLLKFFINEETPSSSRATILSIRGFYIRALFALIAPLLGWITDVFDIYQAFAAFGIALLVLGLPILFAFYYFEKMKKVNG